MPHADFLDQAEETTQAFTDESVARVRKALEPETHPDFDGESCVDCGESIATGRLNLGKVRCIYCQGILEKKSRLFPGLATHSHLGVGHLLNKKSEKTEQDAEPAFAALPEDSKLTEVRLRINKAEKKDSVKLGKPKSAAAVVAPDSPTLPPTPAPIKTTYISKAMNQLISSTQEKPENNSAIGSEAPVPSSPLAIDTGKKLAEKPKRIRIRVRSKPKTTEAVKQPEMKKIPPLVKQTEASIEKQANSSKVQVLHYRDDYRRLVERVGEVALFNVATKTSIATLCLNAWKCILTHRETEQSTVYYYIDRPTARLARISHLIGSQGRIG